MLKNYIVNLLSFDFASCNILDVFHCLDNSMLTEVYFFILSFLLFGQVYSVIFIIEIIDTQNTLVPNFFFNTMNFSMRQLYCLLFSMALLFALSEGRDHRLDHILRLRRRNLKEKFQPSKSYSPLNSALFRSKIQYLFVVNSNYYIIKNYFCIYKIIFQHLSTDRGSSNDLERALQDVSDLTAILQKYGKRNAPRFY